MSNTKTFNYPFKIGNAADYGRVLSDLNNKLDSIKKEVSYFDFYHISDAVTDASLFASQLNNLPLNQALVINTPPFYYNEDNYETGDIIVKNYLGETYHIKAQTGGVFYPQKIEGNSGSYLIHFGFSGSVPTTASSSTALNQVATFAETMTFTGLQPATVSNIYGYWLPFTDSSGNATTTCSFTGKLSGSSKITPFLQFYLCENLNGVIEPKEQIVLEYEISWNESNNNVTIEVNDVIPNLYVKVK